MDVEIRQGEPDDVATLVAFDHVARADPRRGEFIRRSIAAGGCFVATVGGTPVGYAVLEHSFFGNGLIAMVYTRADRRRRGVGSALVARCEAACETAKLFTSTNLSNTPVQRLLAKCGYRMTGYIDNLDEGDPELVYLKWLGGGPA
jgi:GNAT superfamily N-acetyltransferase